jgi:hypothetical protein
MAREKRLTIRLDNELDAMITRTCRNEKCSKTAVVLTAIRKGLALDTEKMASISEARLVELGDEKPPKSEPIDVWNSDTGCCSRYREIGKNRYELLFHFKPVERVNGVQYYTDTTSERKDNRWRRGDSGDWIARAYLTYE